MDFKRRNDRYKIQHQLTKLNTKTMENLKSKIAVITGGNSGIGYATAKAFQKKGAKVIITGRRKEAVEKAATALNVTGLIADQSNLSAIENLASEVSSQYGKIDVLLINAGITKLAPIELMTENVFDEIMNVNFKGAYFTLSKFIPLFK